MKVTDFNRLKKLMGMTTSDSDGEALNALRAANKILRDNQVTWEQVFARLVTVDVEEVSVYTPRAPSTTAAEDFHRDVQAVRRAAYLNGLLDEAAEHATGSFLDFVASLRQQFDDTGGLSRLQVEALEKSVARAKRPAFRR